MIFGIGTDVIEIKRIKQAMNRNPKIMNRIFTEQEIDYFKKRNMNPQHIAGGFSAKEAVFKALGTGLGSFSWKDVEILRGDLGKPIVKTTSKVKKFVEENGVNEIYISISHCREFAMATAIASSIPIAAISMEIENLLFQSEDDKNRKIH